MAAVTMEWTILERLLLAQAVNKYGDDDWIQVARTLKQHPLLQCSTRLEAFNQKNCSLQYYLMLDNMETERRQPKNTSAIISQDMPNVVKLARQLYFQRVEELKKSIKKDEDQFMEILSEIDDIKSGTWDVKLLKETDDLLSSSTPTESDNVTGATKDTADLLTTANTSMNNELKSVTDNATLQHENGVIQHMNNKAEAISTLDASDNDAEDQSNEPSTLQCELQQKQHDDGRISTSDVADGMKRRPYDDEYSTEHLDQHGITESSPKRLKLDNDQFTASTTRKDNNIDYTYKDEETSQHEEPIPTDARLTYPPSNTADYHDTSRTTSASPSTQSSRETQTPSDTSPMKSIFPADTLTDGDTANATGSTESSGNEEDSVMESENNITTPPAATSEMRHSHDDQRQKSWLKSVNLLWREIANHKNGAMFMNPIKEAQEPLYYEVIKQPMDLKTIKNRIREGDIRTTADFERDIMLMLTNSLMYNKEGTEMHQMALEMLQDVTEQIKIFKTADGNSFTDTKSESILDGQGSTKNSGGVV